MIRRILNWFKRKKVRKQAPIRVINDEFGEYDDPHLVSVLRKCFETGKTVSGHVDKKGNLEMKVHEGEGE